MSQNAPLFSWTDQWESASVTPGPHPLFYNSMNVNGKLEPDPLPSEIQ